MTNIFINTTSVPENLLQVIKSADEGTVFVVPNTIDIKDFLNDVDGVEAMVEAGKLVFHAWAPSWKGQWQKDMFSSAISQMIPAGKVEEMVPNACKLGSLIDKVAVPKEDWLDSQWTFQKAPDEIFKELGIAYTENRTEVYQATEKAGRADLKALFEKWYVSRLASQHGCTAYLKSDGTFEEI